MTANLYENLPKAPSLLNKALAKTRDLKRISELFNELIVLLGEDPNRSGLRDTATRAAKTLLFLTSGYDLTAKEIINNARFVCHNDEMVIVKDLALFSICEHHLLPFIGKCHVGYMPNGKVVGLSKIARIVDIYAKRLQMQENLSQQIAAALFTAMPAKGVIVVIEAMHLCMAMRGVEQKAAITQSLATVGLFKEQKELKQEFLQAIAQAKEQTIVNLS